MNVCQCSFKAMEGGREGRGEGYMEGRRKGGRIDRIITIIIPAT